MRLRELSGPENLYDLDNFGLKICTAGSETNGEEMELQPMRGGSSPRNSGGDEYQRPPDYFQPSAPSEEILRNHHSQHGDRLGNAEQCEWNGIHNFMWAVDTLRQMQGLEERVQGEAYQQSNPPSYRNPV